MSIAARRNHIALFVLFLAWVLGQCQKTAIGVAIIPIGKEFAFDSVALGWIISSFYASYAVLTFFGGMIADTFGARRSLTTMIALWSGLTAVTGFVWSLPSFIAARFLCGAAEGGFPSASSVAIADLYPVEQRGRAKAFVVSAAQIGHAVSTFVVAAFVASIGWRYAFWTYAVIGFGVAIAFWKAFPADRADRDRAPSGGAARRPVLETLRSPLVLILFVIQFATGTFFFGLSSWLPTYWVQVRGFSMIEMSSMTAASALVAFAIQNLFGWIIDRYLPGREKYLINVCMLVAAAGLYLMYGTDHRAIVIGSLTVVTTTLGIASSAVFVIAIKYFPKGTIGTATGVANFGQQSAAVLAPIVFGYLIAGSNGSYSSVFLFALATIAVAFAAALAIDIRQARIEPEAATIL